MATIQPTGGSGIANLPAASTVSSEDLSNDGLSWGNNVAETEAGDSSFNFDNYASGVAQSMSAAGFSPSQVSAFLNSLYAGYLMDGGSATSQATGSFGSGVSSAGFVGNPNNWGSLNLPGQSGQGNLELNSSTHVALSPSTAFNLGAQLGSQSTNINYPQYRANLMADLQRAGYSQDQVKSFMGAFDAGYMQTNGARQSYVPAMNLGVQMAQAQPSGNVEAIISSTVMPWLGQVGISSPAAVNAYIDAFRASYLSAGNSSSTQLEGQGYEAGANIVAAGTQNFNLEDYINNTLPSTVPNWNQLSSVDKEIYINAFTAGYLNAGGNHSVATSQVTAPSTQGAGGGTGPNGISTGGTSVSQPATTSQTTGTGGPINQAATYTGQGNQVYAGSTPAAFTSLYSQYLTSSNPTLSNEANMLQNDLGHLYQVQASLNSAISAYTVAQSTGQAVGGHDASWWGNQVGDLQNQEKSAWGAVRSDESKFLNDLKSISSDANASTASALYQNFQNNGWYTLEGNMPSTFAPQTITNPTTGTSGSTNGYGAPVSSAALNALLTAVSANTLPAAVSNELTDAFASRNISQADFTQIVAGFEKLFQTNPQAYWAALGQIKDPNLAGAINYSVQDLTVNHPQDMQINGAAISTEAGRIGGYYSTMHTSTNTFAAWAPNAGDSQDNQSISSAVANWNNAPDILSLLSDSTATSNGSHNEHNYSDAAQFMAYLYKNNRPEYYNMLGKIADPKLRDMLNKSVTLEFVQHKDHYDPGAKNTGTGDEDTDFKAQWTAWLGHSGFTAGSQATESGQQLNSGSPVNFR